MNYRKYSKGSRVTEKSARVGGHVVSRSRLYYSGGIVSHALIHHSEGRYTSSRGRRINSVVKEEKSIRSFDFGGMRFEIYTTDRNELDLSHIKVIVPDQPSHNAEIIHQFTVLNKLRRRQLQSSDFAAAYEREVANHYLNLQADEREVVFNLLQAEYSAL